MAKTPKRKRRTHRYIHFTLRRENRAARRQIGRQLADIGVVNGLSLRAQAELVRDVFRLSYLHRGAIKGREIEKRREVWKTRRHAQLKKLAAKARRVHDAFSELNEYVESLRAADPNGYLIQNLDRRFRLAASLGAIGKTLNSLTIPSASTPMGPSVLEWGPRDPTNEATQILVDFFTRHGLSAKESEIRTAKIGNALWGWNIALREKYAGGDAWRGSDTVRKRLKRARRK